MPPKHYTGNANTDRAAYRGWIIGHFLPPGIRQTEGLEIKWGVHPAGGERAEWAAGDERTTMLICFSGRFRLDLPGESVILANQGDYVVWGPGVEHSWQAEEESVMLTVRWPSLVSQP